MHHLSALQVRDAFLKGEITAVKIAEHFLKRIETHDKTLGAFLTVLTPRVLLQAEALDKKRSHNKPLGKMAGIPFAIKDNMHIANEKTTCGSKFLQHYQAPFHATAIRLIEEEDALLIGKTNLDEFAMGSSNENSAYFPAHNPWNVTRVPGGSSGGSAAAVAARLSLLATGSDTGGSIRQPAALCGVVGFKPTYGRVSRYGLVAFGSSLDQIGPFSTTVEDAALVMETIGRPCPYDSTCLTFPPEPYRLTRDLKEIKIGIPNHFVENLKPEIQKNYLAAIDVMRDLGASTVEIDLDILKYSIAVYYILATAEASTNLARFDGIRYGERAPDAKTLDQIYDFSRKEGFGREVKKRIMLGTYVLSSGFQDAYYKKAQKIRTLILNAFQQAYAICDAVVMPVTVSAAFQENTIHDPIEMYLQDIFTVPANLAGLPAISVPSGFDSENLPLGIQIIGPQMCDVSVMRYAYAYEQASSWTRIPPAFHDEEYK
ncbi:MAG TPA: Asp-tRNA(Asn)/Glu-tRNA(Gln) amidotransferase subunit GatA [Chlamydiales bacterium]|nr:Asp-tRNA(Asn)/Glu-tRNA(Gln) amidotransferase subunit GatA [Chlamydiales bacterium]